MLTSHLELHKINSSFQKGFQEILGKHQRILAYLSKRNRERCSECSMETNPYGGSVPLI
ncbi:30S ribosomal protein s15 chloroplastic [Phtheirospermum japonicum]|uniref:30S ribosomal protein s15 chloroplastic n=1 Tax=Phtheirospermum japonicum TaxID=374723 RepID=A0A830BK58_9LAMI|nr:30S ribosomal protein s15 chloroplastic [Phtheirospermum japonicum]